LSTLVNDGLMRPIKEIQDATHFRKVKRQVLLDQGLIDEEDFSDNDESAEAWVPVCTDPKSDDFKPEELNDPAVKEIDLMLISEKEIFVRKANIKDFKKSVLNCKPTVNGCFLELYAKFLKMYGHEDQKEFAEQMSLCQKTN